MDIEEQAGARGLKYAADKGLAVVIMELLRGGVLAGHIPPAVQALWDSVPTLPSPVATGEGFRRSPAEWALQWVRLAASPRCRWCSAA